jgi:hypothetical protein
MYRATGALLICLLADVRIAISQSPNENLLAPWRYPGESDYVGDWQESRARIPIPFHVIADFNGDGVDDHIWLMIRRDSDEWAVFAFLGRKRGDPTVIKLETASGRAQRHGLVVAKPGTFRTACGKGYFPCRPGEPQSVRLTRPGFELFIYESASVLYYWDEGRRSFRKVQITD